MYQVLAVAHGVVWVGALLGHRCLASFAYDTLKLAKLYHLVKVCHHSFRRNKCEFSSDKPADIRDHAQKVHAELQLRRDGNKLKFGNLGLN